MIGKTNRELKMAEIVDLEKRLIACADKDTIEKICARVELLELSGKNEPYQEDVALNALLGIISNKTYIFYSPYIISTAISTMPYIITNNTYNGNINWGLQ